MEITKESFLKAEDPKNRDAMLFDMLIAISYKIDECNKVKVRVEKCEGDISVIKGVGATITAIFGGIGAWFKWHSGSPFG